MKLRKQNKIFRSTVEPYGAILLLQNDPFFFFCFSCGREVEPVYNSAAFPFSDADEQWLNKTGVTQSSFNWDRALARLNFLIPIASSEQCAVWSLSRLRNLILIERDPNRQKVHCVTWPISLKSTGQQGNLEPCLSDLFTCQNVGSNDIVCSSGADHFVFLISCVLRCLVLISLMVRCTLKPLLPIFFSWQTTQR